MIEQIDNDTFQRVTGANSMTLKRDRTNGWEMMTTNASTRAWNGAMPSLRRFATLAEVESKYKSWRGITQLVTDHAQ